MKKIIPTIVGFTVLITLWQLATLTGGYNPTLFPPPLKVVNGLWELIREGILAEAIARSLIRFFVGYVSAAVLGISLGLYFGHFLNTWRYVNPIAQFLRPISPIAWLPFVVLWFGIGDVPAIVIVFIAAFCPILLTTVSAVSKIDRNYLKVAKNFGLSPFHIFTKIIIPASFPHMTTGLHIAIGTSWVFIVAGEMVGAQSGLGFLIVDARQNIRADLLMAAMTVIGLLGLLIDGLFSITEKRIYAK
jgi:NitT/TauT family transport system permease protein